MSGAHAVELMRRNTAAHRPFKLRHLTYNRQTLTTDGMNEVPQCLLRPAMKDNIFKVAPDHYLLYLDGEDARMCFKKLIREVAFAPAFDWFKVDWFDNEN
jgi:hypothetical protein